MIQVRGICTHPCIVRKKNSHAHTHTHVVKSGIRSTRCLKLKLCFYYVPTRLLTTTIQSKNEKTPYGGMHNFSVAKYTERVQYTYQSPAPETLTGLSILCGGQCTIETVSPDCLEANCRGTENTVFRYFYRCRGVFAPPVF